MGLSLTTDQVLALAPDASSASAGKKLGNPRTWKNLGQSADAIWGECQGSALYQVRVDLGNFSSKCSCPSRKFPCKHGLGLLVLAAQNPDEVPTAEPPEWVASWLAKRVAATVQKQEKAEKEANEPPSAAQIKRAEKRSSQIAQGLDTLDLWMNDLIRNGLAGVESQASTFWENQAKRLVDAQAPGVAATLRRLGEIPGASPDWPAKLLSGLGRVALLSHAYHRLDSLAPALQDDVRLAVGWSIKEEEVTARGELVEDEWLIVGQWTEDNDRGKAQRTWLIGATTHRPALVLQFSYMGQPFPEMIVPGIRFNAGLRFWPGVAPVRARIETRTGNDSGAMVSALPGNATITDFLAESATNLARQPWQERMLCQLNNVIIVSADNGNHWQAQDVTQHALPLTGANHWRMLALSGGASVDLAAEWDGTSLIPLAIVVGGNYYPVWEVA